MKDPFLAGAAPVENAWSQFPGATDVPSSDAVRMGEIFRLDPSYGMRVTPTTAMRVSAVYACVRLLAGTVATLPLLMYQRRRDGSREGVGSTPLSRLLNEQPHPRWTAAAWWEYMTATVMLRGDAIAYLGDYTGAEPRSALPLKRDEVLIEEGTDGLLYYSFLVDGSVKRVDQSEILHLPGFGFDGVSSLSVIEWGARGATAIAGAADRHAAEFMGSGGTSKYVLKNPKRLDPAQIELLREQFVERVTGSASPATPIVLTQGTEVDTVSMTAADAQILEQRRFQVEDICRAFGVPPFMVGATDKVTSWGSGLEQQGRGFLIYTLQPHLVRWEQEINRKIVRRPSQFAEFKVDGLARADMKARSEAYRQAVGGSQGPGWMTIDEVRRFENLPPLGGTAAELYRPEKSAPDPNGPDRTNDEPENPADA